MRIFLFLSVLTLVLGHFDPGQYMLSGIVTDVSIPSPQQGFAFPPPLTSQGGLKAPHQRPGTWHFSAGQYIKFSFPEQPPKDQHWILELQLGTFANSFAAILQDDAGATVMEWRQTDAIGGAVSLDEFNGQEMRGATWFFMKLDLTGHETCSFTLRVSEGNMIEAMPHVLMVLSDVVSVWEVNKFNSDFGIGIYEVIPNLACQTGCCSNSIYDHPAALPFELLGLFGTANPFKQQASTQFISTNGCAASILDPLINRPLDDDFDYANWLLQGGAIVSLKGMDDVLADWNLRRGNSRQSGFDLTITADMWCQSLATLENFLSLLPLSIVLGGNLGEDFDYENFVEYFDENLNNPEDIETLVLSLHAMIAKCARGDYTNGFPFVLHAGTGSVDDWIIALVGTGMNKFLKVSLTEYEYERAIQVNNIEPGLEADAEREKEKLTNVNIVHWTLFAESASGGLFGGLFGDALREELQGLLLSLGGVDIDDNDVRAAGSTLFPDLSIWWNLDNPNQFWEATAVPKSSKFIDWFNQVPPTDVTTSAEGTIPFEIPAAVANYSCPWLEFTWGTEGRDIPAQFWIEDSQHRKFFADYVPEVQSGISWIWKVVLNLQNVSTGPATIHITFLLAPIVSDIPLFDRFWGLIFFPYFRFFNTLGPCGPTVCENIEANSYQWPLGSIECLPQTEKERIYSLIPCDRVCILVHPEELSACQPNCHVKQPANDDNVAYINYWRRTSYVQTAHNPTWTISNLHVEHVNLTVIDWGYAQRGIATSFLPIPLVFDALHINPTPETPVGEMVFLFQIDVMNATGVIVNSNTTIVIEITSEDAIVLVLVFPFDSCNGNTADRTGVPLEAFGGTWQEISTAPYVYHLTLPQAGVAVAGYAAENVPQPSPEGNDDSDEGLLALLALIGIPVTCCLAACLAWYLWPKAVPAPLVALPVMEQYYVMPQEQYWVQEPAQLLNLPPASYSPFAGPTPMTFAPTSYLPSW